MNSGHKKVLRVFIVTISVVCISILIINKCFLYQKSKDEPVEIQGETDTSKVNNGGENAIAAHSFWYDENGYMVLQDFGEYSINDNSIDISVKMLSDLTSRHVKAGIYVFIGGIQQVFYADGVLCEQYEYIQEAFNSNKILNISIPINNIQHAYDNTVRILYIVYDVDPPINNDDKRFCIVTEMKAIITDIKTEELNISDNISFLDNGKDKLGSSITNYLLYSDLDLSDIYQENNTESINVFNYLINNKKFYAYFMGEEGKSYVMYPIIDNTILKEYSAFKCSLDKQYVFRKFSLDGNLHSLMGIVIPVGDYDKETISTLRSYRVN